MNLYEQYINNLNESNNEYITLYHNTSNENAVKINQEGIIPGLRKEVYGKGSEAEGSGIWCSTTKGYGYGGATITFKINSNDKSLEKENDTEFMVFRKIEPNEIVDINLVVSRVNVDGHPITESDIPYLINKYGKKKILDILRSRPNSFVEPYKFKYLVRLVETGEKYCKETINLNEKASIDWNNYLTSNEVKRFKSKEDADSAGDIIYSKEFKNRLEDFKKSGWTDEQLIDDLLSFNWNNHLNEGIHLFAFIKDEDGNDKVIEDSDYSDKKSFKSDLEANGYKVRRINDETDMYIMDNSDYRSVSEVKSALKRYKSYAKEDGLNVWQDKINYLKGLLNKASLKESYTLKGIQDGKSFDISYSDKEEKLEKFKDELQPKHKNINMYIIEESEKDRNHFELWKKQIDSKSRKELYNYYNRLVSQMKTVNKSDKYNYIDLAKKINYIEDTYKIRNTFSYNLK